MSPEEKPISPNAVPVEQLQFRQAEPAGPQAASRRCAACKSPIYSVYFKALGADLCPNCAEAIRRGQQAPPAHSLLKAALYGGGAAVAGCALYAGVAIAAHLQLALIAIVIGYMVGTAVRHGSQGLGGRPQQILAVLLTYFAITFSYVAVAVYTLAKRPPAPAHQVVQVPRQNVSVGAVAGGLVILAAVAPFLALKSGAMSGLLSLLIILFGLRRAWALTGRRELDIFGPYDPGDTI